MIKLLQKLFKKPDFYMVLGIKDFPVNPNDYVMWSEADNPYIFNSQKSAQHFIDTCKKNNKSDYIYFRIVEVKGV